MYNRERQGFDSSEPSLTVFSSLAGRILLNTVAHPFEYAKFLIQIGHEPIPPYPTYTLFGRPAYALPNVFSYIKYIRSVDGFTGCYRGFSHKLASHITAVYVSQKVVRRFDSVEIEDVDMLSTDTDKLLFMYKHSLIRDVTSKTVSIIISHPFHVLALRSMAQFVGGETKYSGFFGSIYEVYKEQGIAGFFSGIVPRWLGEVSSIVLASTLTFLISSYVIQDNEVRTYISPVLQFISNALTYPFSVISSCMAVNNCGLVAGLPPCMPIYSGWKDCCNHLIATGQHNRGSSLLWRFDMRRTYATSGIKHA